MQVSSGKVVTLAYDITTLEGEIIESSDLSGPITVMHGQGTLLPGLDRHLEGMSTGEEKSVELPPEDAFGRSSDALTRDIPRAEFPGNGELTAGARFEAGTADGQTVCLVVKAVSDEHVTTAIVHPLADATLNMSMRVIAVRDATQREQELRRPVLSPPPPPQSSAKAS